VRQELFKSVSLQMNLYINFVAALITIFDKLESRRLSLLRRKTRVPERVFHALFFLGGGVGVSLAFVMFNHKVSKTDFLGRCLLSYACRLLILRMVVEGNILQVVMYG